MNFLSAMSLYDALRIIGFVLAILASGALGLLCLRLHRYSNRAPEERPKNWRKDDVMEERFPSRGGWSWREVGELLCTARGKAYMRLEDGSLGSFKLESALQPGDRLRSRSEMHRAREREHEKNQRRIRRELKALGVE